MHFPQELIEAFIDCLAAECPPGPAKSNPAFEALFSCTLVSKSFSFPAQKYLFSSICFDPYPSVHHRGFGKDVNRLSDILFRIRSLGKLMNEPYSNLTSFITSVSLAVNDSPVLFDDLSPFLSEVGKLLSALPSLASLSLNATTITMLPWSAMGNRSTEMLESLCQLKTLRHISLTRIADVPVDVILRSSVTSIRLAKTVFAQLSSSGYGNDEKITTPLRNLYIHSYLREFWTWFSKVDGACSQIQTVSIGFWTPNDVGFFSEMLEDMPVTLKGLHLSLSGIANLEQCVETLSIHSSRLIHLQDFSIILALGDKFFPAPITDVHPRGWFKALNDLKLPSQIRDVGFTIEMRIAQNDFFRFQDLLSVDDRQGTIDLSLLHRERFPNLKRLTVHVDITIRYSPAPSTTTLRNITGARSSIEQKMRSLLVIPDKNVVQIICTSDPTPPALRSFFDN